MGVSVRSLLISLCWSKPLLQSQGPLISGFSWAVTRYSMLLRSSPSERSRHSFLRRHRSMLQPREQPVHTERTGSRNHTRLW